MRIRRPLFFRWLARNLQGGMVSAVTALIKRAWFDRLDSTGVVRQTWFDGRGSTDMDCEVQQLSCVARVGRLYPGQGRLVECNSWRNKRASR
jgi:hypothetical protein